MSVCNSIRHGSHFQLNIFHHPAVVARTRQLRHLSTSSVPLSPRIPHRSTLLRVPGSSSRNFGWFSSSSSNGTETLLREPPGTPLKPPDDVTLEASTANPVATEQVVANNEHLVDFVPDVPIDTIVPAALHFGDLKELGFCSYTPVGAVQAVLEVVQVSTGLPWWATIVVTTILGRLAIVNFTIKSARAAAKTVPLRPKMDALMTDVKEAKLSGDKMRLQVAAMRLQKIRTDNGITVGASLAGPLTQGLLSISMFIAVKKLCDFPLAQLKFESIGWLPSLASPDPYYILPALSFAVMNLQIHLGKVESAAAGPQMQHFANVFRVVALVFLPIIANLPSGLLIYLVVNVCMLAGQSAVLRIPAVRQSLNIPPLVVPTTPMPSPNMLDTWNAIRQWFNSQKEEATRKAVEKAKAPMFPAHPPSPTPPRRSARPPPRRNV